MKIGSMPIGEELRMLQNISPVKPFTGVGNADQAEGSEKLSFSEMLGQQIGEANRQGLEADRAMEAAVAGEDVEPHSTIIAVQKASISLTLMMSIKERLERAYQELIRTPLG